MEVAIPAASVAIFVVAGLLMVGPAWTRTYFRVYDNWFRSAPHVFKEFDEVRAKMFYEDEHPFTDGN